MSSPTKIAWTHYTINFWWGCSKVSPACKNCYAETMGSRFGPMHFGAPVLWGPGKPRQERLQAARLEALDIQRKAVKNGVRYRVFINSMSDWLDTEVPIAWLAFLLETLHLCPNLDFQLLTKRPQIWGTRIYDAMLMAEKTAPNQSEPYQDDATCRWLENWINHDAPPNLWIGCTAENQEWADKRIPYLLNIPAHIRFLSCEPLSGPINLGDYRHSSQGEFNLDGLHWIIAGGESGTHAQPSDPDWFRSLRDQCAAAHVPYYFKQHGEWLPQDHLEAALRLATEKGIPVPARRQGYRGQPLPSGTLMLRPGTALASNLLDGQKWEQFPVIFGSPSEGPGSSIEYRAISHTPAGAVLL